MAKIMKIGEGKLNVMDFAGSWKLTDGVTNEIISSLRKMWKKKGGER